MPGTVFYGRSSEPAAHWREGRLLDRDGVGELLVRRGTEYFPGRGATPLWRVRGENVYRGASSEPFCRLRGGQVFRGNTSETMYRVSADGLLRGQEVVVRGMGLTAEELLLAALTLDPPR